MGKGKMEGVDLFGFAIEARYDKGISFNFSDEKQTSWTL